MITPFSRWSARAAALDRVGRVFFHLAGADSNDEIEAIEREMAPLLARERNAVYLDDDLFRRVDAVNAARETSGLDAEARRLIERYRLAFVRSGAGLPAETKARLAEIGERLATLGAQFGQNVLADEKSFVLFLEEPADLAGLPPEFLAAAAETAAQRGKPGKHAVTLSRSSIEPFLQFSARRDLREKAFRAFVARGANGGAHDNAAIMSETVRLRDERAQVDGLCELRRITGSTTRWRKRPAPRWACSIRSGRPRARKACATRTRCRR